MAFSPFELVHGYPMRGPLEAIKDGWMEGELNQVNIVRWVDELRDTFTRLYEQANKREGAYKDRTKKAYDGKSEMRVLQKGDMVLVHNATSSGKLNTIWDGPYEVKGKMSNTVYRIAFPRSKARSDTVHINRLKLWHTPTANLFRVVVGQDSEGSDEPPGRVLLGQCGMSPAQQEEIDNVLTEYKDVISDQIGEAVGVVHEIDTGASPPVQAYPYRIAPNWKTELHNEVKQLLDSGIIAPSHSPWSAPMVPIRKTDSSLRLCIDYRKLNAATVGDPYQMPRVDDLLDQVADAKWLSKLDLRKGFHTTNQRHIHTTNQNPPQV